MQGSPQQQVDFLCLSNVIWHATETSVNLGIPNVVASILNVSIMFSWCCLTLRPYWFNNSALHIDSLLFILRSQPARLFSNHFYLLNSLVCTFFFQSVSLLSSFQFARTKNKMAGPSEQCNCWQFVLGEAVLTTRSMCRSRRTGWREIDGNVDGRQFLCLKIVCDVDPPRDWQFPVCFYPVLACILQCSITRACL